MAFFPQAPAIGRVPLIFQVNFTFLRKLVLLLRIREGDTLSWVLLQHAAYTSISVFISFYVVLELLVCLPSLSFNCQSLEARDQISLIFEFSKGLSFIMVFRRKPQ